MLRKLPFTLALFAAIFMSGCNDDDPVNDSGIADVIEFDLDDVTEVTTSSDLAGLWVAVGTGTFERRDGGDVKLGKQSSKIYFLIRGAAGAYTYANCFDEGYLEGDFDRGDFEVLTVTGSSIEFDSKDSGDNLSSDDTETKNVGTVSDDSEINNVFTFNDGDSLETNTFRMIKVSPDSATAIGTSTFEKTDLADATDTVNCFAQWSGSYSTSDGYYTVEKFDASFEDATSAFSATQVTSDAEDITEYSSISFSSGTSMDTKNSDTLNFFYLVESLIFGAKNSGSDIEHTGKIKIKHSSL